MGLDKKLTDRQTSLLNEVRMYSSGSYEGAYEPGTAGQRVLEGLEGKGLVRWTPEGWLLTDKGAEQCR